MPFREDSVNRDGVGRFDEKPQSAPEAELSSRLARLERADALAAEARKLSSQPGLKDGPLIESLHAEAAALRARGARKAAPLTRLNLQPMNRNVYAFLVHDRDDYDLNPPYQRGSVWTLAQRRALFESLLRGIPIGSVTVNDRLRARRRLDAAEAAYAVVDGKQRIETLRAFHAGEFSIPADWLDDEDVLEETPDGEVFWDGLTIRGQRGIWNVPIPVIEAGVATVDDEARIFDLVNYAGTPQGEVRHG